MTAPQFYIFVIISPWKRTWPFIWTNLNFLHSRIMCTKFDWIWAADTGKEDFKKKFSLFLLFRYYLPLEKGYPRSVNKLIFPLSKDDLCQVWLKLAQWFWRRRFLNDPTPFLHFCDYLPFEKDLAHYLKKNLNTPYSRIIYTKFDWFWPAGSEEEDFKKFSVHFYSFAIISPWRWAMDPLPLKKLESLFP